MQNEEWRRTERLRDQETGRSLGIGKPLASDRVRESGLRGNGPWAKDPGTLTFDNPLFGHTIPSWKASSTFSSAVFAEHWL